MSNGQIIALVAILTTTACALAGVFLVLRRMAMMADAISHAILPGLVAGYVLAHGPNLFSGFAGATAAGLVTVILVETLTKSRRVREDTAIGVVFPAMFALGVFVISKFFSNVHIDTDAVLYGEIAFAPFDTLQIGGRDYGPQALWVLGGLTVLNAAFLTLFYKELKLSTFDAGLAASLGFVPAVLHYGLMSMVALTTVGAFSAVGAILAVALIVVPSVTASLLTRRLPVLIGLSLLVGVTAALSGYGLAIHWDVSISGMIATMLGVLFGVVLLTAPEQGLVARALLRRRQAIQFAQEMLVVHLSHHQNTPDEPVECRPEHLEDELQWEPQRVRDILTRARENGLITDHAPELRLTPRGRELAEQVERR
jgi:manganese/zinc/iron transport system permease protein